MPDQFEFHIMHLITICKAVRWSLCLFVSISSSLELLEVSKHEWYHVVTNCLGNVFSPSFFTTNQPEIVKMPKVNSYVSSTIWAQKSA